MKITIVEGITEITSDKDIIFNVYGGSAEFNAGLKNQWLAPNTYIGEYEEISINEYNHCTCKVSKKAASFNELVTLVKDAEDMLINNGYDDMGDRISIIRGIYYGTIWSLDYSTEKSEARNTAFNIPYTGSNVIADARKVLICSEGCKAELFKSLYDSAEVFESSSKAIDFGHLIIGLDSRRSWRARNVKIPTQGGTGLELNTWVGDLGGGTANLSIQRIHNPQKRAITLFSNSGHSYGAMVNLEGDIAAYVVGMDESNPNKINNPTDNFKTIHEALQDYFDVKWNKRTFYFLAMLGGEVSGNKITYIKSDLISQCATKFEDFAEPYNILRNPEKMIDASNYYNPVSEEVSTIFIDALIHVVSNPSKMIIAMTDPDPKPKKETIKSKAVKKALEMYDEIKKKNPIN